MRIKLYENRDFMRRTQIKLMQEEVHIWCIRWKEVIPVFEYYQLMLDQKEKEKMEEYYFYEDRMRYVAGKVITKLVLIQYLEEEEISFLSHKFGKPYYKSISGKQDIEFNISHSGEMILVAFSRDAKIGVDIQEIIDCSEYLEIARSFFEPEEVKNIEESNSKELFFQYWSAKEAYLKAIGVGLLKGMSFFSVKDGVIKENGRKKDHWKLIPIKVQGYAAYIALKENNGKGCLKSIKQISCISSQKREPLWKWLGRLFMWSDLRKTIFVRIKIICWMNWKEGYRSI